MRQVLPVVLVLGLIALGALGQESSALINKALDEQVKLTIVDKTLPQAMDAITAQTGVRLKDDPIIWDLLPWGRETRIQAKVQNVTLREALKVITRTLGLTLVLRDEYVEIQPMPGLKRLAQRASRDELRALDLLASTPLNLSNDRPTIKQLLEAVDLKLAADKDLQAAIENRTGDAISQEKTIFVPRNATLMDALESLTKDTRATWYPWGKSIIVTTKEERTRRLLSKPLTLQLGERGADVGKVLMDISASTGVGFEYQPGVLQTVPADARTISGVFDNAPALDILEAIAGRTGLTYKLEDEKVFISAAAPNSAAAAAREPMLGFIQLDNGLQVLIPASQVPPDLRQYIQYKTQKELDKIRQMMVDEGFKPTVPAAPAPATQPTAGDL